MTLSETLYARAIQKIPGGVNSPVRAFKRVGGIPPFIEKAKGAYITDVDGRRYIDYVLSWGPCILGHTHPEVLEAVIEAAQKGFSFGAPTFHEVALAELICERMPSIEMVRMVNSGTEATMSALRLARGFTNRPHIIKFIGCYHGHHDSLLVKAGSGCLTLNTPDSLGIPAAFAQHTLLARYNHLEDVKALFEQHPESIAGIIVEPVAGNMGCVPPTPDFLPGLKQLCDDYHSLLIFDEVMTGFRVAPGGAQARYGVTPHLTTLGKIIGGGFPVGAYGGSKEIMSHVSPLGGVYQAGTLSGNPIAMAAGLKTLEILFSNLPFYDELEKQTDRLTQGLATIAKEAGIPFVAQHAGSMFGFFFTEQPKVEDLDEVMASNQKQFNQFFHHMLEKGIYLAPSAFEAGFLSICHDDAMIDQTLEAAASAMKAVSIHE